MIDVEAISQALLERVAEVPGVVYATRQKVGIEQLPDFPACIVACNGASITPYAHGAASKWTITYDVRYVARWDGSSTSAEQDLNAWLYAIQEAMQPDAGEATLTLGGVCEHATLSGEVDYVDPSSGYPWMECWVGVEVVAV